MIHAADVREWRDCAVVDSVALFVGAVSVIVGALDPRTVDPAVTDAAPSREVDLTAGGRRLRARHVRDRR